MFYISKKGALQNGKRDALIAGEGLAPPARQSIPARKKCTAIS